MLDTHHKYFRSTMIVISINVHQMINLSYAWDISWIIATWSTSHVVHWSDMDIIVFSTQYLIHFSHLFILNKMMSCVQALKLCFNMCAKFLERQIKRWSRVECNKSSSSFQVHSRWTVYYISNGCWIYCRTLFIRFIIYIIQAKFLL